MKALEEIEDERDGDDEEDQAEVNGGGRLRQ